MTFSAQSADVSVPGPGGQPITQHYEAGTVTWFDGGILWNFPIDAFDRADGAPPRSADHRHKLSSLQTTFSTAQGCRGSLAVGLRCLHTLVNEWDAYAVGEATAARTIFVDNGGLTATEFGLTQDQQDMLFLNGVRAATSFVVEMSEAGRVPRTAAEGLALCPRSPTAVPAGDRVGDQLKESVRPRRDRLVLPVQAVADGGGAEARDRELTVVVVVEEQGVRHPGWRAAAGPLL